MTWLRRVESLLNAVGSGVVFENVGNQRNGGAEDCDLVMMEAAMERWVRLVYFAIGGIVVPAGNRDRTWSEESLDGSLFRC